MKKCNDTARLLASALLSDGKVWDDNAETTAEIAAKIGLSEVRASTKIRAAVAAGQLEKCWKRSGGRPVPAYRVKQ